MLLVVCTGVFFASEHVVVKRKEVNLSMSLQYSLDVPSLIVCFINYLQVLICDIEMTYRPERLMYCPSSL